MKKNVIFQVKNAKKKESFNILKKIVSNSKLSNKKKRKRLKRHARLYSLFFFLKRLYLYNSNKQFILNTYHFQKVRKNDLYLNDYFFLKKKKKIPFHYSGSFKQIPKLMDKHNVQLLRNFLAKPLTQSFSARKKISKLALVSKSKYIKSFSKINKFFLNKKWRKDLNISRGNAFFL